MRAFDHHCQICIINLHRRKYLGMSTELSKNVSSEIVFRRALWYEWISRRKWWIFPRFYQMQALSYFQFIFISKVIVQYPWKNLAGWVLCLIYIGLCEEVLTFFFWISLVSANGLCLPLAFGKINALVRRLEFFYQTC